MRQTEGGGRRGQTHRYRKGDREKEKGIERPKGRQSRGQQQTDSRREQRRGKEAGEQRQRFQEKQVENMRGSTTARRAPTLGQAWGHNLTNTTIPAL